jgi:hypothetical protein
LWGDLLDWYRDKDGHVTAGKKRNPKAKSRSGNLALNSKRIKLPSNWFECAHEEWYPLTGNKQVPPTLDLFRNSATSAVAPRNWKQLLKGLSELKTRQDEGDLPGVDWSISPLLENLTAVNEQTTGDAIVRVRGTTSGLQVIVMLHEVQNGEKLRTDVSAQKALTAGTQAGMHVLLEEAAETAISGAYNCFQNGDALYLDGAGLSCAITGEFFKVLLDTIATDWDAFHAFAVTVWECLMDSESDFFTSIAVMIFERTHPVFCLAFALWNCTECQKLHSRVRLPTCCGVEICHRAQNCGNPLCKGTNSTRKFKTPGGGAFKLSLRSKIATYEISSKRSSSSSSSSSSSKRKRNSPSRTAAQGLQGLRGEKQLPHPGARIVCDCIRASRRELAHVHGDGCTDIGDCKCHLKWSAHTHECNTGYEALPNVDHGNSSRELLSLKQT